MERVTRCLFCARTHARTHKRTHARTHTSRASDRLALCAKHQCVRCPFARLLACAAAATRSATRSVRASLPGLHFIARLQGAGPRNRILLVLLRRRPWFPLTPDARALLLRVGRCTRFPPSSSVAPWVSRVRLDPAAPTRLGGPSFVMCSWLEGSLPWILPGSHACSVAAPSLVRSALSQACTRSPISFVCLLDASCAKSRANRGHHSDSAPPPPLGAQSCASSLSSSCNVPGAAYSTTPKQPARCARWASRTLCCAV